MNNEREMKEKYFRKLLFLVQTRSSTLLVIYTVDGGRVHNFQVIFV